MTELDTKFPQVLENFRKGKLDDADLKVLKDVATDLSSTISRLKSLI